MAEQWLDEATNSTFRAPVVGTATVGMDVQSWVCGEAHGLTLTA